MKNNVMSDINYWSSLFYQPTYKIVGWFLLLLTFGEFYVIIVKNTKKG